MESRRPDPEELLARVKSEEARAARGKLTIFFGAAPGVGKTYTMLEAARLEKEEGRDVVVGIVETHGRYDTGALVLGHELLPRRRSEHRGIVLEELDLDAALARRPGLLLVDELAHTNAPGSRHAKRWQDVQELLDAGIDVFTTLNVQHLESLNDVVAQITHVRVRETVPDAMFEQADDVRLLDLPIEELLGRLREGKVYAPDQAELARANFFKEGNLFALRELALRQTAQRVDAEMRRYRAEHGIDRTWPVAERVLVGVSASPASEALIRAARRLASTVHGKLIAAYVETPAALGMSDDDRARLARHLQLAQSLGADTVTLAGSHAAEELVRFARSRNVTRILVGKPTHPRWRDRLRAPFIDEIVRLSGDIEVTVLPASASASASASAAAADRGARAARPSSRLRALIAEPRGLAAAFAMIALCTAASEIAFGRRQVADVAMLYVLGIVLVSLRWGFGPSLFAAILAVLSFDFFFIPPYFTFAVADFTHVLTFAVMFVVAAVISDLTRRVRQQADAARDRELRTATLYALSRALAAAKTRDDVLRASGKHVAEVFRARVALFIAHGERLTLDRCDERWAFAPDDRERAAADWVFLNGHVAGLTTDTLPASAALYVPLEASGVRAGVLGVVPEDAQRVASVEARQHLDAFAGQIASALERTRLAAQAQEAKLRAQTEQLRNALLSSVSHDLRTPLAVITGTATTLLDPRVDEATRRDLAEGIVTEADRLNRLVRNLLDMTRLEAGAVEVKKEWQPVEEAVGAALERTSELLGDRPITTHIAEGAALVPYDSLLLQQVLVNLLENAAKYTPAGSPIEVRADEGDHEVVIGVLDRGPGLDAEQARKVFDKFYRARPATGGGSSAGVGLGLTICKAIVEAHGGRIWVEAREGGGAAFRFALPLEGAPPEIDTNEPAARTRPEAHGA